MKEIINYEKRHKRIIDQLEQKHNYNFEHNIFPTWEPAEREFFRKYVKGLELLIEDFEEVENGLFELEPATLELIKELRKTETDETMIEIMDYELNKEVNRWKRKSLNWNTIFYYQ